MLPSWLFAHWKWRSQMPQEMGEKSNLSKLIWDPNPTPTQGVTVPAGFGVTGVTAPTAMASVFVSHSFFLVCPVQPPCSPHFLNSDHLRQHDGRLPWGERICTCCGRCLGQPEIDRRVAAVPALGAFVEAASPVAHSSGGSGQVV